MFENKIIKGIHATRFIMSWIREGGKLGLFGEGHSEFNNWLKSLGLSKEEIFDIMCVAKNGKLELEISAKKFMKDNIQKDRKEEA